MVISDGVKQVTLYPHVATPAVKISVHGKRGCCRGWGGNECSDVCVLLWHASPRCSKGMVINPWLRFRSRYVEDVVPEVSLQCRID